MKKILVLLVLALTIMINAQNSTNEKLRDLANEAIQSYDVPTLMNVAGLAERILNQDKNNNIARYYLALMQYLQIQTEMRSLDKAKFKKLFDSCVDNSTKLLSDNSLKDEAYIILASVYMMKISVEPEDAMNLFGAINQYLENAETSNLDNPRVHLTKGMFIFNTPEMFGGGPKNALPILQKAEKLFLNSKDKELINWGLIETYTWIGQVYAKQNDFINAKLYYAKALEINPEYSWVKYALLPQIENK